MLEKIISVIAPHTCVECGLEGALLCEWCKPDMILEIPSRCYRCYAKTIDSAVCEKCRSKTSLRHVWVRAVYTETGRELVYRLKFQRAKAAANQIADLLDEAVPYLPSDTIVTYVPTATSRVRIRGYDQTKLIARSFAKHRNLNCCSLLIRLGQSRQVRASRTVRAKQAEQNYRARGNLSEYSKVVLIDDILTTGATVEAAARVLKKAGVKHVDAAVFAQKQ